MPNDATLPPPLSLGDFTNAPASLPSEPSLAPLTVQAAAVQAGTLSTMRRATFAERNTAPGTPLDVETGIPTFTYFQAKLNRLKEDQANYLKSVYGEDNVRISDTGEPIVRVIDSETGKPKDVKMAPDKLTLRDAADLGAHGMEILGGFLAARKGDVRGVVPVIKNIGRMAVGTEAGGATQDVLTRGYQGQDMLWGEIFKSRGEAIPLDFGGGLFMASAGKVLGKVISPFADPAPAQFNLAEAKARLQAKYPVVGDILSTPGELTGSPLLLRAEAFARQKIGSAGIFAKITAATDASIRKVQDILLGRATPATSEEAGQSALDAIGAKLTPLRSEVEGLKKGVAASATEDLRSAMLTATGTELRPAVPKSTLGQAIREVAASARDAWKAASGYEEFFANPVTQAENVSLKSLSSKAAELLKSMPGQDKITTVPTGVLDARGVPITRDEAGREVWKEFIPERVVTRLQRLADSPDAKLSLDQLKQMRTEVDDDILTGEAVPGVRNLQLKRVRSMLTDAMSEAVDSFGDPALTTEWQRINAAYKANVPRFEQKGIAELFRDPQNPNWIGNDKLVQNAINDPDVYHEYLKFFGKASPVMDAFHRRVAEDVLTDSSNALNGLVDGRTFVNNLKALATKSPEMAQAAFGPNVQKLYGIASAETAATVGERDRAAMLIRSINGKVDLGDLQDLLASGNPTAQKLVDLVSAQNKIALEFRNGIKKAIAEGGPLGEKVNPSDFVNYFSRQGEPRDIKEVMSMLSDRPDITQSIQRQTLMDIFSRARSSGESLTKEFGKSGQLTASGLEDAMGLSGRGGPTQVERYRSILGADTWQDLTDLGHILQPREAKSAVFGTAGRLSVGSDISQLERGNIFHFLDTAARNFIISGIYSMPVVRKWVGNVAMTPADQAALLNYMVASTPFVEAMVHHFGDKRAAEMAAQIKFAIDQSRRPQARGTATTPSPGIALPQPLSLDYFKRGTNAPAP